MRVIEQLVRHFWERGAISRDEAQYLVKHGFVREADLPGFVGTEREIDPQTYEPPEEPERDDRRTHDRVEEAARQAEELEAELAGRKKGGGKGKKKPTGHNLDPARAVLAAHSAARVPYPALIEWADRTPVRARVRPCAAWPDAARRLEVAGVADREAALVALLNQRPRALGELWFWFDLEPLFEWADRQPHSDPVADALGRLLRAANPNEVGRTGQLAKVAEVRDLLALLAARRAFLVLLPALYDRHFAQLRHWLVPPAGEAAGCWPALPWAYVMVYNARRGTIDIPPPGYEVRPQDLSFLLLKMALTTAYPMAPTEVRELLIHGLRDKADPLPDWIDWSRNAVFDRPLYCPLTWRV